MSEELPAPAPKSKENGPAVDEEIVYVVDDDAGILEALETLLSSAGYHVKPFSDPDVFLAYSKPNTPSCLILDLNLGKMSGLDLLRSLVDDSALPVIFLTGFADVSSAISAMKGGAIEYLSKPPEEEELLAAVRSALSKAQQGWEERNLMRNAHCKYATLTPRERDVLPYIVRGFLNKQTAYALGIREITVRIHRRQIMRKMGTRRLADLLRLAAVLQIPPCTNNCPESNVTARNKKADEAVPLG